MTNSEETQKAKLEDYVALSKNSLVRVQYSCGGNSTSIDDPEYIPIVSAKTASKNLDNQDNVDNP